MDTDYQTPTTIRYFDPKGMRPFNDSRTALHEAMIASVATRYNTPPPHTPPQLIVIAGGPGAGKSTITKVLEQKNILTPDMAQISIDDFSGLPEFQSIRSTGHPHPEKHPILIQEHNILLTMMADRLLSQGRSIVISTHGDDPALEKELHEIAHRHKARSTIIGLTRSPESYLSAQERKGINVNTYTPWALSIYRDFCRQWPVISEIHDDAFLYRYSSNPAKPALTLVQHLHKDREVIPSMEIHSEKDLQEFEFWQYINPHGRTAVDIFPQGTIEEIDSFARRVESRRGKAGIRHCPNEHTEHSFGARLMDAIGLRFDGKSI